MGSMRRSSSPMQDDQSVEDEDDQFPGEDWWSLCRVEKEWSRILSEAKNLAKANCENSNENSLPKKKSSLFFMPWQLYKYPWLSLTHSNRHFRISSEWSFFLWLYSSLTKCDSGDLILSRHLIRVMSRQKESSLLWCQRSFALLRCFVSFSVCIDFLFLTVKMSHINAGSW